MIPQNKCSEQFIILEHTCYIQFSISWTTTANHKQVFCCLTRVFCPENSHSFELPGPQRLVVLMAVCELLFLKTQTFDKYLCFLGTQEESHVSCFS